MSPIVSSDKYTSVRIREEYLRAAYDMALSIYKPCCTRLKNFHGSFTDPYKLLPALASLLEITSTWLPVPFANSTPVCAVRVVNCNLSLIEVKVASLLLRLAQIVAKQTPVPVWYHYLTPIITSADSVTTRRERVKAFSH